MLVAIGASWSPKVAIFGFHSAAGWINLLLALHVLTQGAWSYW